MKRLRARPGSADRGAVSVMVAITAAGLVILVAVVLDLGGRLRAIEQTDALAQEAARIAGQRIDEKAVRDGQGYHVVADDAQKAVDAYLGPKGLHGNLDLSEPLVVKVRITTEYRTTLLGVVNVNTLAVQGYGKATLVHGITEAENG